MVNKLHTLLDTPTCLFTRDNAAILNTLPILPEQLDVLILRDASASPTLVVHKILMQKLESIFVGAKVIKRSDFTRAYFDTCFTVLE